MTEDQFEKKMQFGRRLGINIASKDLVWSFGFIGTYKHVFGVKIKEEFGEDAELLAIAEELLVMQGASRLIVGKFFYASINFMHKTLFVELFHDEFGIGDDYKKEIHPKFLKLMERFASWLNQE